MAKDNKDLKKTNDEIKGGKDIKSDSEKIEIKGGKDNIKIDSVTNTHNKPVIPNLNLNSNQNSIEDSPKLDSAKERVSVPKENIIPHLSSVNNDNKIQTPKVETVKEDPFEDSLNQKDEYDDPFASDTKTKGDDDVFK